MRLLKAFMAWRWRTVVVSAAIVVFVVFLVNSLADHYVESQSTTSDRDERASSAQGDTAAGASDPDTTAADARDLYARGRTMAMSSSAKSQAIASDLFNSAISTDPQFAGGYAGLSQLSLEQFRTCSESCEQHLEVALDMARKAVELDPVFALGQQTLAEAMYLRGEFGAALAAIDKAIEIEPDNALIRATYGRILGYSGKIEEGIAQLEEAFTLDSSRDELLYALGAMYRFSGQFDAAIKTLREHDRRVRGRMLPSAAAQLAAAYLQAGRMMEAREKAQDLRRIAPRYSIRQALRSHRFASPQATTTYREALRELGLRED